MITKRTVFVLGAGASNPYNFPIGTELADLIRVDEGSISKILPALAIPNGDELFAELRHKLQHGPDGSIDQLLGRSTEYHLKDVGKLAIAYVLIGREQEHDLGRGGPPTKWHFHLLSQLLDKCDTLEAFHNNKVSVVTFNYDRSLEQGLFLGVKCRFYKATDTAVANAVSSIPVIHVHGHLGLLPWQGGGVVSRPYENKRTSELVRTASQNIQIISDVDKDTPDFQRARQLLAEAERIYILGFGYHDLNMERLKVPFDDQHKYIVGTSFGMAGLWRGQVNAKYFAKHPGRLDHHHDYYLLENDPCFWQDNVPLIIKK